VEDAAVGLVKAWAEGVKASKAEVWAHVARAFKAEEAQVSKDKVWVHAAKALDEEI
jgi:hypothetical protein